MGMSQIKQRMWFTRKYLVTFELYVVFLLLIHFSLSIALYLLFLLSLFNELINEILVLFVFNKVKPSKY